MARDLTAPATVGAADALAAWRRRRAGQAGVILGLAAALMAVLVAALALGAYAIPAVQAARALIGLDTAPVVERIVWNIRLPQALSALIAGAALATAGAVMQAILRNPLASPFTLGVSQAAAFGAAFAVMIVGSGQMASTHVGAVTILAPWLTTGLALVASLAASGIIIAVARLRGASPEVMVLTGVALGALFTAGTMMLQFFASDTQLAAMVFWTFGDAARANWGQIGIMAALSGAVLAGFLLAARQLDAIVVGDETARGLGVRVGRLRLVGMVAASLATAVVTAFLGIIGFVGLVAPHMVRRVVGGDHAALVPASALAGAVLTLAADTVARLVLLPQVVPVSVITAFLGAPVFLALILQGRR